uniref:Uncharacterized protein n=1 Tax=Chromera velia CCMP2878 TaxID=1169474 RepID=A0A0G4HI08_9ALVE|eukprot:Cvel_6891.t1-p1 / transcript=Cvel_6891.t1 / gene=Cvel_6891 / organism=Chromera_velia_CCMP2878 / gene_product=Serine/threonine-protein kinase TNNI3K, putative / transcript_product=Serine/threonine-protein kinase TNNI3K, putative / location=Cvel_scaffold348:65483-68287(+) / protein_length=269 / sequence_SO=supercontig / SO=protein_coding / is_pseudo=false
MSTVLQCPGPLQTNEVSGENGGGARGVVGQGVEPPDHLHEEQEGEEQTNKRQKINELRQRREPPVDSRTLFETIKKGEPRELEDVLRQGVNIKERDPNGLSVLHLALQRDPASPEIVKLLVEAGADVNATVGKDGLSVFHMAACSASPEVVKMLVEAGADVNAVGQPIDSESLVRRPVLHHAVTLASPKTVQVLLEAGADVNAVSKDGFAVLYLAAAHAYPEVVKMLLEAGADVNAMASVPDSLLFLSCARRLPFSLNCCKRNTGGSVP